jgi:Cytochrome bd terminal oxidase subunit II
MADIPIVFILAGIAAYTVLAGADFGAGLWTLLAGPGRAGRAVTRDHARHTMGPVWEANHVWLIFVLVVCWTAYPVAFGSITSTLAVPLFVAAVGIILRGASYALRGQLDRTRGQRPIENLFALSSILTPFALGTVVGGTSSRAGSTPPRFSSERWPSPPAATSLPFTSPPTRTGSASEAWSSTSAPGRLPPACRRARSPSPACSSSASTPPLCSPA